MIVLDASARIRARIEAEDDIRVPHLFEVEVLHTLRREYLRGLLSDERAKIALNRLSTMGLTRHPHAVHRAYLGTTREHHRLRRLIHHTRRNPRRSAHNDRRPARPLLEPSGKRRVFRVTTNPDEWFAIRRFREVVSSGRTISWSGASSRTIKETKSSSGLGMKCWNRESRFSRPSFLENFALPPDEPGRGFGGGHPDSRSERSAERPSIRAFHKRFPARRDASERNGDGSRYTAR